MQIKINFNNRIEADGEGNFKIPRSRKTACHQRNTTSRNCVIVLKKTIYPLILKGFVGIWIEILIHKITIPFFLIKRTIHFS